MITFDYGFEEATIYCHFEAAIEGGRKIHKEVVMTVRVADEILGRIARQQHDLFRRVREGTLDPEGVSRRLQEIIEDRGIFRHDMTQEGWKLVEDTEEYALLGPGDLAVYPFSSLYDIDNKASASYGQRQAEYLLGCKEILPEEWRQYTLVFPGTVWEDHFGHRVVCCLRCGGTHWYLDWLAESSLSYSDTQHSLLQEM